MESSNHHADVDVSCQGNHCVREVHTFRLKNLNGIFVLADPPHLCGHCKPPLIFDGPLEGEQKSYYWEQHIAVPSSYKSGEILQIRNSKLIGNRMCVHIFFSKIVKRAGSSKCKLVGKYLHDS